MHSTVQRNQKKGLVFLLFVDHFVDLFWIYLSSEKHKIWHLTVSSTWEFAEKKEAKNTRKKERKKEGGKKSPAEYKQERTKKGGWVVTQTLLFALSDLQYLHSRDHQTRLGAQGAV